MLVAGTVVTILIGFALDRAADRYLAQSMNRYAGDVADGVSTQMAQYGATLTDVARGVAAQSDLHRDDWEAISAGLDSERLPGVSAYSFVIPARSDQYAALQRRWRGLGATGLTFNPVGTGGDHLFIVYAKAADGGAPAPPGTDVGQVPELVEAMSLARSSEELAATGTYILLKDRALPTAQQKPSFSLVAPVVTRTGVFQGWMVLGVHGTDFLDRTLSNRSQGMVQVVLDESRSGRSVTIASALAGTVDRDPSLVRERTISVGQRVWHLSVLPTNRLRGTADTALRAVAMGSCIGGTLVVALMVAVLAEARNRAETKVEQRTAELLHDIARRKEVEQMLRERESELHHLAFHDPLTGLANRILFYDRVSHALLTHARGNQTFAVIFVDLDGFKSVNDRLGHVAGDELLCVVATRLTGCLRESDTVARFGGDEFAVVTERLAHPDDARKAAARIVEELGRPYDLEAGTARVSASVGIALNRPGDRADDVLREADLAMYTAKKAGKARFVVAG